MKHIPLVLLLVSLATPGLAAANTDRYEIDATGKGTVTTGHDGKKHNLKPLAPRKAPRKNPAQTEQPCAPLVVDHGPATDRVMLNELGYTTPVKNQDPRGDCSYFAAAATLETAYLVEHYKMTSDQFTAKYGRPLTLSPQYITSISAVTTMDGDDVGLNLAIMAPYCNAPPTYGVTLDSDWPVVTYDVAYEALMMQTVSGSPHDTTGLLSLLSMPYETPVSNPPRQLAFDPDAKISNGLPLQLNLDLANYSWSNLPASASGAVGPSGAWGLSATTQPSAVFPGQAVHEKALWAPTQVGYIEMPFGSTVEACGKKDLRDYAPNTSNGPQIPSECIAALAAPLEQELSQHRALEIGINLSYFAQDPAPKTGPAPAVVTMTFSNPDYVSAPAQHDPTARDHAVTLVGYDRTKQRFRIKNSWGTGWGTGGYADLDYAGLLTVLQGDTETYVKAVHDPGDGPVPNLVWRGFWQAKLAGKDGVAVIESLFGPAHDAANAPDGTFYANDGAKTPFHFLGWELTRGKKSTTYSAKFGDAKSNPLFSLTLTEGSRNPIAKYSDASDSKRDTLWAKCNMDAKSASALSRPAPRTFLETENDPYVLPPCLSTPPARAWHTTPTWTCPKGGQLVPQISNANGVEGNQFSNEEGVTGNPQSIHLNSCLVTSTTVAPSCPSGSTLNQDIWWTDTNGGDDDAYTGDGYLQDRCVPQNDYNLCKGANGATVCSVPSCPTPGMSFNEGAKKAPQPLDLGSPFPWILVQAGADACVEEVYEATATCPDCYELSPNHNDCILKDSCQHSPL